MYGPLQDLQLHILSMGYMVYLVMLMYFIAEIVILGIKKGSNIKRIFLITFSMGNVDVTLLFHMDFSDYRVFESNRDKVA